MARHKKGAAQALRIGTWLPPLLAFLVVTGAWQLAAVHNRLLIPTIGQILSELGDHPALYLSDLGWTMQEAAIGLLVSFVVAFLVAILMCHLRIFERALMPLAVVLNVTPIVALAPAFAVIFGFGFAPKYVVTGVIVFFPFLVNLLAGLRAVENEALDVVRSLHASWFEILVRLRLPASLPYMFSAARICVPLSIVGAVVAEVTVSGYARGLGSLIETANGQSDIPPIYASVLCLAIVGVVLTVGLMIIERRLLRWYFSARSSV